MATTTISDHVIWAKHIHDDPSLASKVLDMQAGETIELEVEGEVGTWRKMDNGKDGRPTAGLRPLGAAQTAWQALYKQRRGGIIKLAMIESNLGVREDSTMSFQANPGTFLRSDAERQAALAALLDGARQGYRSEGRTLTRDDMHE